MRVIDLRKACVRMVGAAERWGGGGEELIQPYIIGMWDRGREADVLSISLLQPCTAGGELYWCSACVQLCVVQTETHEAVRPAVFRCAGMDVAALHQGYSSSIYCSHFQVWPSLSSLAVVRADEWVGSSVVCLLDVPEARRATLHAHLFMLAWTLCWQDLSLELQMNAEKMRHVGGTEDTVDVTLEEKQSEEVFCLIRSNMDFEVLLIKYWPLQMMTMVERRSEERRVFWALFFFILHVLNFPSCLLSYKECLNMKRFLRSHQ